jgi:hypothetical protein
MKPFRLASALAICCAAVTLAGCGGGSSSNSSTSPSPTQTITTTGSNVLSITINSGPADEYVNGAFASVTVCLPGTSTCQTIDGLLVDTGSSGLRILSSALNLALPQQTTGSTPVFECLPFITGYTWGPVATADVQVASEKASSLPIQIIGTNTAAPTSCSDNGQAVDSQLTLGSNGILGVGLFPQDCGNPSCPANANLYFECPTTTTCSAITENAAQEVQNPVALFSTDNNGVIVELPSASGPEASATGSLIFGIGTESNNALGSATVYDVDPDTGNFSTDFNGTNYTDEAFIDSGSNGYFFPDSSIPQCPVNEEDGFYCPNSTLNLSATAGGITTGSGKVNFSVDNAVNDFNDDPNDTVFPNLGGTADGMFDWGLPFFLGRNVYVAILGQSAPGGTAPYWAF